MESLDTPNPTTQPYSDSHNSPVDPALFNNKRDSAYSSFSASSNTSDYVTVPLRPGEACSMDNLLQSLGPSCRGLSGADTSTLGIPSGVSIDEAQRIIHKSRSLTRPRQRHVEVKGRPSSCCYEDERRGDFVLLRNGERGADKEISPPQPPTRKDSFKATRSRNNASNKRSVSAPIEISTAPCYYDKNKTSLNFQSGIHNGFPAPKDTDKTGNFNKDTIESFQRETENISHIRCDNSVNKECNSESTSDHRSDQVISLPALVPFSPPSSLPTETSLEVQRQSYTMHSQTKHSTRLHRHSAPDKLLATQLELLQFNSDSPSSESYNQSNPNNSSLSLCSSQWSQASLQPMREDQEGSHNHLHTHSNKWDGSRCSTPGSVFLEGDDEVGSSRDRVDGAGINGECLPRFEHQYPWGRSVSVPMDPTEMSAQGRLMSDHPLERDFEPLSTAASVDTLLENPKTIDREESGGKKEEGEKETKKSSSSKNHRRNRRRSERFATNLRNEIQRKKAQLQSSRGPGGLLYSGETVQEEEGTDLNEEVVDPDLLSQERSSKIACALPVCTTNANTIPPVEKSNNDVLLTKTQKSTYTEKNNLSKSVQIVDPGVRSFGVGIRVVEEPAPAGKARRWRWTPEHKLQPDLEPDRRCVVGDRVLGVTASRHGVCAFTSSSTSSYGRSSSCSRMEESDILPFADRMKFFEETSKGAPALNIPSLSSRRQKKPPHHPELHGVELGQHPSQRRYSYQGGIQQEGSLPLNPVETRRMSVSTSRERQKEEREQAREMEERGREWEERSRKREWQQEKERQEMELEMEKARVREVQQEREREERAREWEKERERELELEREKEMEKAREADRVRKERQCELESEKERLRDKNVHLISHQDLYGSSGFEKRDQDFQHMDNFHNLQPKPQAFSHSQTPNQFSESAFHPVNTPSQPTENCQPLHQGYTGRSYTPTEVRMLVSLKCLSYTHIPNLSMNTCLKTSTK